MSDAACATPRNGKKSSAANTSLPPRNNIDSYHYGPYGVSHIAPSNPLSIIKGEIHNVLSVMRPLYASPLRFQMEMVPTSPQTTDFYYGGDAAGDDEEYYDEYHDYDDISGHNSALDGTTSSVDGLDMMGATSSEHHPLLQSFRQLNDRLSHLATTTTTTASTSTLSATTSSSTNIFDTLDVTEYITPFCTIISSPELNACITGVALNSLTKFLLYNFISEKSTRALEGITLIAKCIRHCSFEESNTAGTENHHKRHEMEMLQQLNNSNNSSLWFWGGGGGGGKDVRNTNRAAESSSSSSSATKYSNGSRVIPSSILLMSQQLFTSDEEVVLKLINLSALLIRCPVASQLSIHDIVGLFDTCLFVAKQTSSSSSSSSVLGKTSSLLRSAAGDALGSIILVVFGRGAAAAAAAAVGASFSSKMADSNNSLQDVVVSGDGQTLTKWPSFSSSTTDEDDGSEGDVRQRTQTGLKETLHKKQQREKINEEDRRREDESSSSSGNKFDERDQNERSKKLVTEANVSHENDWHANSRAWKSKVEQNLEDTMATILHRLSLLADPTSSPIVQLALSLINIALETASTKLNSFPAVIPILQNTLCKHLLQLSTTYNTHIFSLTLRVIFNLFNSIKNHLKVQLEVFLTSVHLRVLTTPVSSGGTKPSAKAMRKDTRSTAMAPPTEVLQELALESLVEFCQEPMLMMDIYYNYDCDVHCSNLFEALCSALARVACPRSVEVNADVHGTMLSLSSTQITKENKGSKSSTVSRSVATLNALNRLALEGILAIVDSIAQKCTRKPAVKLPTSNHPLHHGDGKAKAPSSIGSLPVPNPVKVSPEVLQQRKERKRCLSLVAAEYNRNPLSSDWVHFAVSLGVFEQNPPSPANVAEFLYCTPNLNKTQMGLYLSKGPPEKYPFHAKVLGEFVNLFDFNKKKPVKIVDAVPENLRDDCGDYLEVVDPFLRRNGSTTEHATAAALDFSVALRTFLSKFRLPGEAQCIDRLMEAFAKRLFEQERSRCMNVEIANGENADSASGAMEYIFKSSDSIYILAFSTIMLNTDLHNPNMPDEKRMTVDQFLRNNRGINEGENLPDALLRDLYAKIQNDEIRVQQELSDVINPSYLHDEDYNERNTAGWDGLLTLKSHQMATPFFSESDDMSAERSIASHQDVAGVQERDMFLSIASSTILCIQSIFNRSRDDALVIKCLRGFYQIVCICAYFELPDLLNEVLITLLECGHLYATNVVKTGYRNSVESCTSQTAEEGKPEEDTDFVASVLANVFEESAVRANEFFSVVNWDRLGGTVRGCAAHRGLLSLYSALDMIRGNASKLQERTLKMLVECLFMLRDANALPPDLSDLDDFGDHRGVQFPLSIYARQAEMRANVYVASLVFPTWEAGGSPRKNGFWNGVSSLLSGSRGDKEQKLEYHVEKTDMGGEFCNGGWESELLALGSSVSSPLSKALLRVVEQSHLDRILLARRPNSKDMQLAFNIISAFLGAIDVACGDDHSFASEKSDNVQSNEFVLRRRRHRHPMFEHHAVFALELAARSLLANRQHSRILFPKLLQPKLEAILKENTDQKPYLAERALVTILRSWVHLHDIQDVRPSLTSCLQLLAGLPEFFLQHVADRLACGMAIILQGAYRQVETEIEWSLIMQLLEIAARHNQGTGFILDGISSCIDQALRNGSLESNNANTTSKDEDRDSMPAAGAAAVAHILIKFVSGRFDNDFSVNSSSIFYLETVYQCLLRDVDKESQEPNSLFNFSFYECREVAVKNSEALWLAASLAFYRACLSSDAETSRQAFGSLQRILLIQNVDRIHDNCWLILLNFFVDNPASIESEGIRGDLCGLLGKLLLMTLPNLSRCRSNWDILTRLVRSTAAIMGENLQGGRRGGRVSILFESTVQVMTNVYNVMSIEDTAQEGFCHWVAEAVLEELDRYGAAGGSTKMLSASTRSREERFTKKEAVQTEQRVPSSIRQGLRLGTVTPIAQFEN